MPHLLHHTSDHIASEDATNVWQSMRWRHRVAHRHCGVYSAARRGAVIGRSSSCARTRRRTWCKFHHLHRPSSTLISGPQKTLISFVCLFFGLVQKSGRSLFWFPLKISVSSLADRGPHHAAFFGCRIVFARDIGRAKSVMFCQQMYSPIQLATVVADQGSTRSHKGTYSE